MRKSVWIKVFILIVGVLAFVVLFSLGNDRDRTRQYYDKSVVYKVELGDMFSAIELSSEEVKGYFEQIVSEVLTWKDVYAVFDALGYGHIIEHREKNILSEPVSREAFCKIYQIFVIENKISVSDCIFTYYGHVPDEESIISDIGNYRTSLPKEFFSYGERYKAVVSGNKLLFIVENGSSVQTVTEDVINETVDVRYQVPTMIDVVLTNDNGQQELREHFDVKITSGCSVISGVSKNHFDKSKVFNEKNLKELFTEDMVMIIPDQNQSIYVKEADSGKWSSPYRGILCIYKRENLYWIVNQVPLEQYLYGVVPGEMPERFHLEALKAQAVCARTYACNMMNQEMYKEFHADVDDSVNCQVYNKHGENEKATMAVDETKGIVMIGNDTQSQLAEVYYFSTSCGFTTGLEAWGAEQLDYLQSVSTLKNPAQINDWNTFLKDVNYNAYDDGSNYFRWKAMIRLPDGYSLQIDKREDSGIVTEISYKINSESRSILGENNIRKELGQYVVSMTDIDGKEITTMTMLPSAWFVIESGDKGSEYILYGGGYGHGIGLSQYGAHGMAESNYSYKNILEFYYTGIKLKKLV